MLLLLGRRASELVRCGSRTSLGVLVRCMLTLGLGLELGLVLGLGWGGWWRSVLERYAAGWLWVAVSR